MDLSCAPELLVDTSRLLLPPPHPTRIVMINDARRMTYDLLFTISCSSSALSGTCMITILSGGSADIESDNSLVPLLCVPGFPLVCSEQRKIEKLMAVPC
jgi:hypothetical protein